MQEEVERVKKLLSTLAVDAEGRVVVSASPGMRYAKNRRSDERVDFRGVLSRELCKTSRQVRLSQHNTGETKAISHSSQAKRRAVAIRILSLVSCTP